MKDKEHSKYHPNIKCIKCGKKNWSDESFWSERPLQSYFFLVCNCGHERDIPIDNNGNPMIDNYSRLE